MNSQRLLCSQKAGVKCSNKSFLVYKMDQLFQKIIPRYKIDKIDFINSSAAYLIDRIKSFKTMVLLIFFIFTKET